jgi:hypothetical protein
MKSIPFSNVREFYTRNNPDGHWFDSDTMRFFKTKLPTVAYEGDAGVLFVTSEVDPSGVRAYSVRRQNVDGTIKTVGAFHSYKTSAAAKAAIAELHKPSVQTLMQAAQAMGKLQLIHVK